MLKTQIIDLEIFIAVVESLSFTKAAEQLNIAASVVSRSIKKLEQQYGTTLLHRTTRKISLTQEGEWLFSKANEIVNSIKDTEAYLIEEKTIPKGMLRIDAATPFAIHALAPLISGFNQLFPHVKVVLEAHESNINLIDRKVDVAIRIGTLEDSSLKAKKLGHTHRKLYAAPTYIKQFGRPSCAEDLIQHKCLGFSKPSKLNTWPIKDNNNNLVVIEPSIFADNGETIKQLAVKGAGIACISAFTTIDDVKDGNLIALLEQQQETINIPVYAVYYADKAMSSRVRVFIDYISEHINLG
ncbi:LysR family transcriptional regulator [Thalassotalea psychrophila]|uniref:LysR family transcriptional regulator n=1 Tax=Thalassotalea psychrophila TaxID=3065647 RepID=A0ABY9TYW7_9GAMM|nr:LysR family transcriptional regulator [Colwelliaceae bacterium SQ149]